MERPGLLTLALSVERSLDDLRSPIRAEREEPRNLHFFPAQSMEVNPEAPTLPPVSALLVLDLLSSFRGCRWHCHGHLLLWDVCTRGTNPVAAWGLLPASSPAPPVPPLPDLPRPLDGCAEIQANGDTWVTEAITRARHSLSDPNMRVSSSPCPCELAVSVPGWAVRGLRQACRWRRSEPGPLY